MFEKRILQLVGLAIRLWVSPRVMGGLVGVLVLCCGMLCLQGCGEWEISASVPPEEEPALIFRKDTLERRGRSEQRGLQRYVDYEGGVVCYSQKYALSCVPLSQTRLDETQVVEDATD